MKCLDLSPAESISHVKSVGLYAETKKLLFEGLLADEKAKW